MMFYDTWAMSGRAATIGNQQIRQDLSTQISNSNSGTERAMYRATYGLTYVSEVSTDSSIIIGQAGTIGGAAKVAGGTISLIAPSSEALEAGTSIFGRYGPRILKLGSYGKPLATGTTLGLTGWQGSRIAYNLYQDGGDSLSVGDWVDLGFGAGTSWHLTGGVNGRLNPLRLLEGEVDLRDIRLVSPYELNRTHNIAGRPSSRNVAEIAESLRAEGWNGAPIQAVENGGKLYIFDGNHRVYASKLVGLPAIPVEVVPFHKRPKSWQTLEELLQDAVNAGPDKIRRYK